MRRLIHLFLLSTLILAIVGCGTKDKLLQLQGRLLKSGQQFEAGPDELIQVTMVPIMPNGELPRDHYYCNVDDATGIFVVTGKTGKGLPPGKYRVALELMKRKKDIYKGKYDQERSPYVFEIDAKTKEIVIDLDLPPVG